MSLMAAMSSTPTQPCWCRRQFGPAALAANGVRSAGPRLQALRLNHGIGLRIAREQLLPTAAEGVFDALDQRSEERVRDARNHHADRVGAAVSQRPRYGVDRVTEVGYRLTDPSTYLCPDRPIAGQRA